MAQTPSIRTIAAIAAGKLAGAASRASRRGGGTAVAGLAALRVDPHVVRTLVGQAGAGAIAVTGTNGKTTTSLMLNGVARAAGLRPLHNRSGSNLMRGVAAMLVEEAGLSGRLPDAGKRLAILEVDEATLPEIVREASAARRSCSRTCSATSSTATARWIRSRNRGSARSPGPRRTRRSC